MKRQILEQLLKWKEKKNRKPLLLTGVRQCGKTYILKEFGNTSFDNMAYFNFDGNVGLQSVFEYDFGKHTDSGTATKIRLIWNAIPSQIARDNNKFIFSHVKQGTRAKDLEDELEWLVDNMDGVTHVWSIPLYTIYRLKEYIFHEMGWKTNK